MAKYEIQDHYLDPETGVLKNKLGIRDEDELKKAEASLVAWRGFQLSERPIKGRFDLDHLKAIHKHLFSDLYEWAGELRNVNLARDKSFFANHNHIVSASRPIFEKLANENYLSGLDAAAFSSRSAYYLGEINALHPFREGNGRAQREFINHLAYENGYFIEWRNIDQENMIQGSIESFQHGDSAKLASLICGNLRKVPGPEIEMGHSVPGLMVEERIHGKPRGKPVPLTYFVQNLPEKFQQPLRKVSPSESKCDPAARRAHYAEKLFEQLRGEALEHMREDIKAGRNLSAADARQLNREDLEKIKTKGDGHLREMIQEHEKQRGRER